MTQNEYNRIEKVVLQLDNQVSIKTAKEIERASNYRNGYAQAVSDLLKVVENHIGCCDVSAEQEESI